MLLKQVSNARQSNQGSTGIARRRVKICDIDCMMKSMLWARLIWRSGCEDAERVPQLRLRNERARYRKAKIQVL
jgi:hypothetical protein